MDRYIIKVDDREMISIYYEEGCIFLKILINGEVKGERILIQGVRERYTVNLSPNGYIYLFCQNISGDIIHLKYKTGELSQNIILENKSKNCKDILFYCIENNSEMNLIYNIPTNNKNSFDIMKQTFDGRGKWNSPEKIDSISNMNEEIFKLYIINFGYGIIFYQKTGKNRENILGYREFNQQETGKFNSIYSTNYKFGANSFLVTKNAIHFVFVVKNIFSSKIIYRKKSKEGFCDSIVLAEVQQVESCSICEIFKKIYVFWKIGNSLFYSVSENDGKSFSRASKYTDKIALNLKKANFLNFNGLEENCFIYDLYTNKINACDIQIIPEIYKNFLYVGEGFMDYENDFEEVVTQSKIKEIDESIIERLKNQINLLNTQIDFKNKQIEQLNASLKRKNEEIISNDKIWKEKYKIAISKNEEKEDTNKIE